MINARQRPQSAPTGRTAACDREPHERLMRRLADLSLPALVHRDGPDRLCMNDTNELIGEAMRRRERRQQRWPAFATLLERLFSQSLTRRGAVSPHTVSSCRDTIRRFLVFAQVRLGQMPSGLTFEQAYARLDGAFPDDLETRRKVSVRSRNLQACMLHPR